MELVIFKTPPETAILINLSLK